MFILEILVFIGIGILFGILTGLVPGIHINMVSALIITYYGNLTGFISDAHLVALIVSMAITHNFLDFIPTTFLGVPSADNVLSALPSHKFLIEGRGYEAVKISIIGSLTGLLLIALLSPLIILTIPSVYENIKDHIGIILIISSAFLIFRERDHRIKSLLIFLFSGILGAYVLNSDVKQPLLALFTGLFGVSSLFVSIFTESKIPEQKITEPNLDKIEVMKTTFLGFISSLLTGFLPGMGTSQPAIISTSTMTKKIDKKYYILLIGAINIIVMILSFVALYSIEKSRNGIGVAIQGITEYMSLPFLIFIISVSLISASFSTYIGTFLAKYFSKIIQKINYNKLSVAIIIFLIVLVFIISGFVGLLILFTATSLGIITQLQNIPRHHLMGSLVFPMIFFFIL